MEARRAMIQRYGFERFMRDAKFKPVQRYDFGTLFRRQETLGPDLCFVEVVNSTPEPDGTFKRYMLRLRFFVSALGLSPGRCLFIFGALGVSRPGHGSVRWSGSMPRPSQ
jgi:hypothetical protein